MQVHRFGNRRDAALALAGYLGSQLETRIGAAGSATLVLPGGKTPIPMLNELSRQPVTWARVTATLTDERWVPPQDARSNAGMLRREFLVNRAAEARFVGLYHPGPPDEAAVVAVTDTLATVPANGSIAVLGMGEDGHTASLFPGIPRLAGIIASTRPVELVFPPQQSEPRITLTPHRLKSAAELVLLFFGEKKYEVFERAAASGNESSYPVSLFIKQPDVPLQVFWAP